MWTEEYKKKKFYWGSKPEKGLKEVLKYAPKGVALDIGAGEGRNSVFLAKNGFEVEAIDKIKEGLEKCKILAKRDNLLIKTKAIDIKKFRFEKNKYVLIIAIDSLDFLKLSEIEKVTLEAKKSLKKNGIFYLSVFSVRDPIYYKIKQLKIKPIEKNTFFLPRKKNYRHFFTKNEFKILFNDFKILYLKEFLIKDTSHNRPHFHKIIKVIAIKNKSG